MKTPDHISYTQINMFNRCPVQWFYRYCKGMKIPPAGAMLLGRAVDTGLSHNFSQKIETHKDLPKKEVVEVYADSFDQATSEEWQQDEDKGELKAAGVGCIGVYYQTYVPEIQPVASQPKYTSTIKLDDEDTIELVNYPDVITVDDKIIDMKTAKTAKKTIAENYRWELALQHLSVTNNTEISPTSLCLDYMVRLKRECKAYRLSMQPDEKLNNFVLKYIAMMLQSIQKDVIIPNRTHYMCSEKYCGYWGVCHEDF